jgi:hypothetical protein
VKDRHDDQVDALAAAFDSLIDAQPISTYRPPILGGGSFEDRPIGLDAGWGSQRPRDAIDRFAQENGWIQLS